MCFLKFQTSVIAVREYEALQEERGGRDRFWHTAFTHTKLFTSSPSILHEDVEGYLVLAAAFQRRFAYSEVENKGV